MDTFDFQQYAQTLQSVDFTKNMIQAQEDEQEQKESSMEDSGLGAFGLVATEFAREGISGLFNSAKEAVVNKAKDVANKTIEEAKGKINEAVENVKQNIADKIEDVKNTAQETVQNLQDTAQNTIKEGLNTAQGLVNEAQDAVQNVAQTGEALVNTAGETLQTVASNVASTAGNVANEASNVASNLASTGQSAMQDVIDSGNTFARGLGETAIQGTPEKFLRDTGRDIIPDADEPQPGTTQITQDTAQLLDEADEGVSTVSQTISTGLSGLGETTNTLMSVGSKLTGITQNPLFNGNISPESIYDTSRATAFAGEDSQLLRNTAQSAQDLFITDENIARASEIEPEVAQAQATLLEQGTASTARQIGTSLFPAEALEEMQPIRLAGQVASEAGQVASEAGATIGGAVSKVAGAVSGAAAEASGAVSKVAGAAAEASGAVSKVAGAGAKAAGVAGAAAEEAGIGIGDVLGPVGMVGALALGAFSLFEGLKPESQPAILSASTQFL